MTTQTQEAERRLLCSAMRLPGRPHQLHSATCTTTGQRTTQGGDQPLNCGKVIFSSVSAWLSVAKYCHSRNHLLCEFLGDQRVKRSPRRLEEPTCAAVNICTRPEVSTGVASGLRTVFLPPHLARYTDHRSGSTSGLEPGSGRELA